MQGKYLNICIGALATALVSSSATAASAPDLEAWNYESIPGSWTASKIIDADVTGLGGEDLGDVHNLILGADGKLKSVIVEAGGVLDIGDNHFRVPWSKVDMAQGKDSLTVPVSEDNMDAYTVFDGEKLDESVAKTSYRATEMIRTFIGLEDRKAYGMVTDLVFSENGQLEAVVAQPTAGYGGSSSYAFPYMENSYKRATGTWEFPYDDQDVEVLKSYDPANIY